MIATSLFTLYSLAAMPAVTPDSDITEWPRLGARNEPPVLQDDDEAWKGSVTVGAAIADGNSDIERASATADAVKKREKDRWTLGFSWNYASEDGDLSQRRTFGSAQYDYFLSEKLYVLAQTTLESDFNAELDLRYTIGGGAGYQFRDDEEWKLAGEAGLSYFNEEFDNGDDDSYVAARLAYNADWMYSEMWTFGQKTTVFPSLEDTDDVYAKVDTRAKASLTENMFAQAQWIFDWDNTPADDADRVDNLFLLTIGWTF